MKTVIFNTCSLKEKIKSNDALYEHLTKQGGDNDGKIRISWNLGYYQ
jgi:hypothetical protein